MSSCSSKWWHVPVYTTISILLAFIAISTAIHSSTKTSTTPTKPPIFDELSINASNALRKSGFNIMAALLQVSPELFLSVQNSTIFAIKDSAISNTSVPPWLLNNLLKYHISPLKLSMSDFLKMPQGSCFPTLYQKKNIAITKINRSTRFIEINRVVVSHPDIFLGSTISVHGVLAPFTALDLHNLHLDLDFIQSPICHPNSSSVSNVLESKNTVEWNKVIQILSSNGFVSFAIGLQAALDRILEECKGLSSVTILAPLSFGFVASPSPLLDKVVRFHILPKRFLYKELSLFRAKTLLRTMVPDQDLEITGGSNWMQRLVINGVEIVAPEIFYSKYFVIHGISRAFEMPDMPQTSR